MSLSVAVVTSTQGRNTICKAIESVRDQSYEGKVKHYVFAHGQPYHVKVDILLEDYPYVEGVYLPNANGGGGLAMAPVFAAAPYIVNEDVVFFLDDDTNPNSTYFEDMLDTLLSLNAIGVSGLAINPGKSERIKPSGLIGFLKKISFLDSNIDGKMLISGIGIPVRKGNNSIIEVEWLIGCSCWDFQKIKKLKFEEDFIGYSLGEDVIFSVKASKLGNLFVNSNIVLDHLELPQTDLDVIKYNYMWVYNRFRLSKYIRNKIVFYLAFYLSILSKIIVSLIVMPRSPIISMKQIIGLTQGIINIFRDAFKR
jgi:GT2 family glycosyltransferase